MWLAGGLTNGMFMFFCVTDYVTYERVDQTGFMKKVGPLSLQEFIGNEILHHLLSTAFMAIFFQCFLSCWLYLSLWPLYFQSSDP